MHVRLGKRVVDLGGQINVGKPPCYFFQAFRTLFTNGGNARLRELVENTNVVHSPIAASDHRDACGIAVCGALIRSERKDAVHHSAPFLESTAGVVRKKIFRSSHREALRMLYTSIRIISS